MRKVSIRPVKYAKENRDSDPITAAAAADVFDMKPTPTA